MRPDREQFVKFECSNLAFDCKPEVARRYSNRDCCDTSGDNAFKNACCKHLRDFNTLSGRRFDSSQPYDIRSIMHYAASVFARPGMSTLVSARRGLIVPTSNNARISRRDAEGVCRLYRPQCDQARRCARQGCPAVCKSDLRPCSRFCRAPDAPPPLFPGPGLPISSPPCCDAAALNARCRRERARCEAIGPLGCQFLV